MSTQVPKEASSSASPEILINQRQREAGAVGEALSSAPLDESINPLQIAGPSNAVKTSMSPVSSEPLIDQQRSAGSSDAVRDQLEKQIAGLEDEIRHFKLKQDPNREVIKHTLLQEELAQLREKNLNLSIDLRVAREKYQALESEHHKGQEQMKEAMEKAMENLSAGLDLSKRASTSLGLKSGVEPGASLFQQRSIVGPKTENASGVPNVLQTSNFGFDACPPARTFQPNRPEVPKPPLFDFSSSPFPINPFAVASTPADSFGSPRVKKPASGDTQTNIFGLNLSSPASVFQNNQPNVPKRRPFDFS